MGFKNPYQTGPFLFRFIGYILGCYFLYSVLDLLVAGGRLFDRGLLSDGNLVSPDALLEPEVTVLIFVSLLYFVYALLIMYRAYWVRGPLYVLFVVLYLDTLHKMIAALDFWGAVLNIIFLILTAFYIVWHRKYINESYPWRFMQWLVIFCIILNFALGPLSEFIPVIPNISDIVSAVIAFGLGLWEWFYSSATIVE